MNKLIITTSLSPSLSRRAVVLAALLATGCGGLLPKGGPPPTFYTLDGVREARPAPMPAAASASAPTLLVNPPHAAPGFDSQHIVYVRIAHQLEHFAHSEWVDTPARMIAPLMVAALENTGAFRAVGSPASGIAGELRLDTEVLRLQQEFGGGTSRVRFTLRASIADNTTRKAIASREFDASVAARSDDPYGGVVAANRAVQQVMQQLASYCSDVAVRLPAAR
jgi:cholesterol transport system auxiliary component